MAVILVLGAVRRFKCHAPPQNPGRLAAKMEMRKATSCLGSHSSTGVWVTCPDPGVETLPWDRRLPGGQTLHGAAGQPHRPASPSLLLSPMGAFWIHNLTLVPIFKRQTQFFFCFILKAKMFNFQTVVSPGKCFKNRKIRASSCSNAGFNCRHGARRTEGVRPRDTAEPFLHFSSPKLGLL